MPREWVLIIAGMVVVLVAVDVVNAGLDAWGAGMMIAAGLLWGLALPGIWRQRHDVASWPIENPQSSIENDTGG